MGVLFQMATLKQRLEVLEKALNCKEKTVVYFKDGRTKEVTDTEFIANNWDSIKEIKVVEKADKTLTTQEITYWGLHIFHDIPEQEIKKKLTGYQF